MEFELPEPEPGEFWGRDESFGEGSYYQLPASGILKVRYMTTPMVPRFDDCIDEEMVDKLMHGAATEEIMGKVAERFPLDAGDDCSRRTSINGRSAILSGSAAHIVDPDAWTVCEYPVTDKIH